MCQLCIEANEPMEPTDDKLIGSNSEEHVGFSTAHSVNPDQGTTNQESISSSELPSARPAISLTSIDSFASNYSDYSVDVSPNDGHNSDEGCLENVQDYPRKGLPNGHLSNSNSLNSIIAIESSDYLKEHSKEGKNGIVLGELGLRSASFKSTCEDDDNSSNDEAFDETKEPSSTFDDRDDIWTPPDAENEENNADHSMAALDDEDDEFVDSDGTQWAKPSSLNCHEDDVLVSYHFREEKQKAMEEVMNGKFKNLVSQLLKNLGVDFYDGDEGNWADIVTLLAWQAALYIRPDGTEAKAMDPAGYVKIKCIATGSSTESRLVKGLVFKKHAAHKHMATKYKNPRLLLIRGMLDGSSGSSGLSSFSSMITEDEGNLTALLEKLEACNPNVILVEKSANRHVVEGLLKLGATLVLDMKLHRLERVARCTGSSILSSDAIFGLKLSHCDSVYFEKYVEEHAIVGEGEKKPKKTLMFLEGCPKRLGCTILLKGSHSEELKKIKRVVLFAVVMAYHFILETSFLVDQKTMFSTFAFSPEADLSSAHEQSSPVVFEPVTAAYSEDSNGGSASAYEDQIPISNSDDDGSSHIQESIDKADKAASLQVHDIPISNGFHEEESLHAKEVTTKATETATSNGCHEKIMDSLMVDGLPSGSNEPHMPTLTRSLPSISDDMEKVSIGSSDAYLQMSAYVGLQERQIEIESVASAPVSPSDEAPDGSNIEAKGSIQDKPVHHHSRSLSSLSVIGEDAMKVFEDAANADGEDCIRPMDEISSVLDSESILVLMSSRNALKGTICEQSHFSHIKFYRNFDFPLGKFLLDNLFNQTRECKGCDEPPEAHFYYYAHHSKLLTIRVKRFGDDLQLPGESEGKIWMWSRCGKCEPSKKAATKRVLISTAARGLSFGKFLELSLSSHSCFNRLSSCGHSFQKDFLCFFGLGSTVAMFRYSRVARYKVSVPAQKLVFNSAIDREWLHGEIECVYTKGLLLFSEVGNYLKNIEPRFAGSDLVLNGSSKGFSDIEELLKSERSQFEENIKNIGLNNEESHNSVHKLLSLNQLRWDILLEASIWNQRLRFLLSFLSKLSRTASINGLLQRQMNLVEDRDAGGRTREPQTASEKVAQEQMIVDDHKVEEREEAKDEPLQGQTGLADNHDEGAVAEADVKAEGSAGLDDNSNVEVDQPQSTIDSIQPDETIEPVESILHTKHNISETSSDGEVQVERVTEGDELSVNDSPSEEILREHGEQVLMKLPVAEESIQKPTVSDSEPSVPSLKESLGSPNVPFEQLECNGESHQTNEISLPGNVLEGRSMPVAANGDDAIFSFERQPSQLPSPNSDDPRGWIWHPFAQVRERCMRDLRKEPIIDIIPALCQVVNEEGSRLHIPVSDDGYVVSDYDGEISSSVACALAMVKDRTLPSSNREENATLKRAASEPSPNLSLKSYNSEIFHSVPSMTSTSRFPSFDGLNRLDSMIDYERIHPEVTLGIDRYSLRGKYSVVIMYADQFRALRDLCCPSEIDYIASLSRCKIWDAKGGKSKSFFAKTLDDRLIIKEIKKTEFESFLKFAPNYFIHTIQSFQCGNQTCLAKILGIYQVTIRHANGRETKHDLMVQENLSFGRNISRQYDLKGALHARFTATSDGTGDVLLDQNFVNDMNSSPLYIGQRAKRLLQRAVWNDTTFLNSINVMDYSLLVGVDRERRELVCGIIDYLRQYTWDKQLETWVKSSLVVPKNVLPTIISPKEYKKRFRKFMDTHFLTVPDHWCSQRSSNPCKLCCIKAADESSIIKSSDKQEEEINGSYAYE